MIRKLLDVGVALVAVGVAFGAASAVVVLLYREWRRSLYTGLSADKIADIDASGLINLLFGVALVLFVVVVVWRTRQTTTTRPRDDYQVIEGEYRPAELPDYRRPVAALPSPRVISVPVYSANGAARPIGATAYRPVAETVLETTAEDANGQSVKLDVNLRYLLRFASLRTPSRSEWTGRPALYSQCLAFYKTHGIVEANGAGWKWKAEYPLESRREWLSQFEPGHELVARAGDDTSPTAGWSGTDAE